jgi:hypothetical protein
MKNAIWLPGYQVMSGLRCGLERQRGAISFTQ